VKRLRAFGERLERHVDALLAAALFAGYLALLVGTSG
jgi:hypothetical protein